MLYFYPKDKSYLIKGLSPDEFLFVDNILKAMQLLLPHVIIDNWSVDISKSTKKESKATWDDSDRRVIRVKIYIPQIDRDIETIVIRKIAKRIKKSSEISTLDTIEFGLLNEFAKSATSFLNTLKQSKQLVLSNFYSKVFIDYVVLNFIRKQHQLDFDIIDIVDFLRRLAEESYENKSISYGIIIDKDNSNDENNSQIFPKDYITDKKYKALSDGFKSAFLINKKSQLVELSDIEQKNSDPLKGEHFFPEWCRNMAMSCTKNKIGFSLTRQGDILFFQNGSLKFSRRFGQWQYWNHSYIIRMLKLKARAQRVQKDVLGKVVAKLYRYSLDISFKRSGGLFVLIRNQIDLNKIVRDGDGLRDNTRGEIHKQFEDFLVRSSILGIDRNVMIELSSIDGAIVISNHGKLMAYGAVLVTTKNKRVNKEQGSRSKAAVSASNFGIAIKISSDGGISFYEHGEKFIEI